MITKLLYTTGDGSFKEMYWEVPALLPNQIMVKAVMTGVCRSDIDMMQGEFGPLPIHMSGHEGLGQVIEIGAEIVDVSIGDYVATRGEPAYASIYPVREGEFVRVPEAHPRYILEPVACGINVVDQAADEINKRSGKILIIGSGFLAWVAYHRLMSRQQDIDVLGSNNQSLWGERLLLGTSESYDVVIDLSGKYELGTDINLNNNTLIIDGVGKAVSRQEAQAQLWKACTTVRPSPRTNGFYQCMKQAAFMIANGYLDVDSFWTRAYNRDVEWQQAFADGANRPNGYSRGYIVWP
jgi:threonine dehydrogenase-like Zn-dependent dehydrogenase